jgi:hypothetical protein
MAQDYVRVYRSLLASCATVDGDQPNIEHRDSNVLRPLVA